MIANIPPDDLKALTSAIQQHVAEMSAGFTTHSLEAISVGTLGDDTLELELRDPSASPDPRLQLRGRVFWTLRNGAPTVATVSLSFVLSPDTIFAHIAPAISSPPQTTSVSAPAAVPVPAHIPTTKPTSPAARVPVPAPAVPRVPPPTVTSPQTTPPPQRMAGTNGFVRRPVPRVAPNVPQAQLQNTKAHRKAPPMLGQSPQPQAIRHHAQNHDAPRRGIVRNEEVQTFRREELQVMRMQELQTVRLPNFTTGRALIGLAPCRTAKAVPIPDILPEVAALTADPAVGPPPNASVAATAPAVGTPVHASALPAAVPTPEKGTP